MTIKQFQEFVIEFIQEQKEFNKIVVQRLDNIEHRLDKIESCPTIQRELNFK